MSVTRQRDDKQKRSGRKGAWPSISGERWTSYDESLVQKYPGTAAQNQATKEEEEPKNKCGLGIEV